MKTGLYNQLGEVIGEVDLPDRIFGLKIKPGLVHQALVALLANSRQVLAHTKGRGEVRGGGRKPWRQKGTGRARHASIRSPIWRGGGVTFGPTKERNFKKKINKKMKRQALFMALASKLRDQELLVLEDLKLANPKTKEVLQVFDRLAGVLTGYRRDKKKRDSILLITPDFDRITNRATRNLDFAGVASAKSLDLRKILEKKYLILLKNALPVIERTYRI